ncbi:MAG: hypothetical protein J7647_30905 [Cyanobacteria bacterium SBLK]|nr:hypothetical protein [Cyanobacteria bacterium SBLK]
MKKTALFLMSAALLTTAIACNPAPPETTTAPAPTTAEEKPAKQLTLADYEAIANGITLEEARKALESDGKQMSSSEVAGIKTEIYIWENTPPTSNITLTFQDGKMVSKAQFGLE